MINFGNIGINTHTTLKNLKNLSLSHEHEHDRSMIGQPRNKN